MTPAAEVEQILDAFAAWAPGQPDVVAVALLGSWARGEARPDSDVDVVVVSRDHERRAARGAWPDLPPFETVRRRRWGMLLECRLALGSDTELEIGVVPERWALDAQTQRVARGGLRVVYDPDGRLDALVRCCAA
jgi:predicted nucleotidyltransferase